MKIYDITKLDVQSGWVCQKCFEIIIWIENMEQELISRIQHPNRFNQLQNVDDENSTDISNNDDQIKGEAQSNENFAQIKNSCLMEEIQNQ